MAVNRASGAPGSPARPIAVRPGAPVGRVAPSGPGVSLRAALIGLILMPVNVYWITVAEVRWYTLDGTSLPLFIQPIFFLFCLCLLNFALLRWRPRWAFRQGELLTVYVLLSLSCVFASHDLLQNLFGVIAHPFRFATPENKWAETFLGLVPRWLFVSDKNAVDAFYNGNTSPYRWELLRPWLVPLAWWGFFVLVLVVIALAGNVLVRRQWTENERLSFPLVQLPLAMTEPEAHRPFWTSRVMWVGFATAALITIGNGLHWLYPSLPYLEFIKQYDISESWNTRPWSAIRGTRIAMYPFAIGLAYFMPLDLCFSCWFFFVWRKAQQLLGDLYGWNDPGNVGWPYFREQSSGAWIGLIVLILLQNRSHLTWVGRAIAGARVRVTSAERQRYRWAAASLAGALALMTLFIMAMGASFGIAAAVTGIYLGLSLAITRVRAELGTPHEINFVSPRQILISTMGTQALARSNLAVLAELHWFNRGYRSHPMPNQLEAMKMAEGGRMELNRLIVLMLAASVVAILVSYWANLHVTYLAGADAKSQGFKSWVGRESFNTLSGWLQNPVRVEPKNVWFMGGGLSFVLFLKAMRTGFAGWPFHPAGYALAMSFAMDYFWFAFLVSWFLKLILVRYGGMRLHTAAAPFFLGLILGDYVAGSVWAIYGPAMGITTYKIFI